MQRSNRKPKSSAYLFVDMDGEEGRGRLHHSDAPAASGAVDDSHHLAMCFPDHIAPELDDRGADLEEAVAAHLAVHA
jgi:hypothetical protein